MAVIHPADQRAIQQGFSVIELMIALLVGLLVTLAVISSTGLLNLQRKITVSGADAQSSSLTAISIISRESRMAGAGLFNNGQLLCPSINIYYNGATISNAGTLLPVSITSGGNNADSITFIYASTVGGLTTASIVKDMPNPSANFTVNHQGALAVGDVALIGVPGSNRPCTLFNVTKVTPGGGNCGGLSSDCVNIQHNPGSSGLYNPPNPNTVFSDAPTYGSSNTSPPTIGPAIINRIGTLRREKYEILCNTLVSTGLGESGTISCSLSPLSFTNTIPQVNDIVYMKAQYGISANANSDQVISWENASGATWQTPSSSNIPRIKAIRVVVVARDREISKDKVTFSCINKSNITNTGPCSFQDAQAPIINLVNVPVPTGKTWQHFRYKVSMNVIPLRNVTWNY